MQKTTIYKIAGLIMALVMILGNTIHTQAAAPVAQDAQTSGPSVYWGALVNAVPSSANLQPGGVYDTFETRSKKKMSIIHWGQPWMMQDGSWGEFQTTYFNNVRNRGSIPMLNWASQKLGAGVNQSNFQLRDVYSGTYDTYIRRWATDAKNWGHPFFLRFNHEMNGWWFPWGEGKLASGAIVNGNSAGDYVKAWRHVHDIFVSVGATNVTWVWAPNHIGNTSQYPALSTLYPGDAYVDWTGFSVYNQYSTWLGLNPLLTGSGGITWLKDSYNMMLTVAPNKPIMLAEWASSEAGDGGAKKAAWITDALMTQIPINLPKIKAVVWFNWDDNAGATFPIESSQASINAWGAGISSATYASNQYANLNTSPIPALAGSPAVPTATRIPPTFTPTATRVPPTLTPTATRIPPTITPTATRIPPTITPSPTVIPPTPTASPAASSATLIAVADTYMDSANPASAGGGASPTLYVNASPAQTTFLKFDLTPLAGKTISTVTLTFKTMPDASAGSANSLNVKLVNNVQWKEQYLSYSNTVAVSATLLGAVPANSIPNTWYQVALAPADIQPRVGGLLSVAIEATGPDDLLLYSREAPDKPQLIVAYQ